MEVGAAPPDADGLRGLSERLARTFWVMESIRLDLGYGSRCIPDGQPWIVGIVALFVPLSVWRYRRMS